MFIRMRISVVHDLSNLLRNEAFLKLTVLTHNFLLSDAFPCNAQFYKFEFSSIGHQINWGNVVWHIFTDSILTIGALIDSAELAKSSLFLDLVWVELKKKLNSNITKTWLEVCKSYSYEFNTNRCWMGLTRPKVYKKEA